jgi:hypothetical protein
MGITTGVMSNYLENKVLNYLFTGVEYKPPEVRYIALYENSAGPTDSDTGTEQTAQYATYYERFRTSASSVDSRFIISGSMAYNQEIISWGPAGPTWHFYIDYGWGIRDSLVGGNLLFWGLLDTPIMNPPEDSLITLGTGKLQISLCSPLNQTTGGWTAIAATKIINWLTNGSTVAPIPWTPANGMKVALIRNPVFDAGNNLVSWTEVSTTGTGYSQQTISASSWDNNSIYQTGTFFFNGHRLIFTEQASSFWGTVSDILLYDSTSASALYWGHLPTPIVVNQYDKFIIESGALTVTLDDGDIPSVGTPSVE